MASPEQGGQEKKSIWDNRFLKAAVVTLAVVFGIGVVVNSVS